MKKLLILVIIIVGLLVAGLFYLGTMLGSGIKTAINRYAPNITEADTRVDTVTVSPFSGDASILKFHVGNPEGFQGEKAMAFGEITVKVDTGSVFSDTIVVDNVEIHDPEFTLEGLLKNNLKTLLNNVQRNLGGDKPAEAEDAEATESKKVVIKRILVTGAKVDASALGANTSVTLDDILIENDSDEGITPRVAVGAILQSVLAEVMLQLPQKLQGLVENPGQLVEGIQQRGEAILSEATEQLDGVSEAAKSQVGRALETTNETVDEVNKKANEAIQGLFGE